MPLHPARPHQGGVEHVRPVRGPDHRDILQLLQPVELGQDLADHALGHVRGPHVGPPLRDQCIHLVEEDDGRGCLPGLPEDLADPLLGLADPLGEELGPLHRDEVALALVCHSLCKQGLSGPRGTEEKDSLGRLGLELLKDHGEPERPFDRLLQLLLHVIKPADILPGHVRHLHEHLPHRRWLDVFACLVEVSTGHLQVLEELGRDLLVEVDLWEDLPERMHRGLLDKEGDVRPHKAVRGVCVVLDLHVIGKRHPAGVDLEDLEPPFLVRDPDLDLAIKPPAPPQCRVEGVGDVRGTDHHHLPPPFQAVHQGEELGDDPALHLALGILPLGGDRVDFVDEDDRRGVLLGILEDLPELPLALPVILAHDLGAREGDEVGIHLVCHRLCDQGLSGPRRAVEEHALRRLDPEPFEELGMPERELDHLPDHLELAGEAPDILVMDIRDLLLLPLLARVRGLLQLDRGLLGDHRNAFRGDLGDHERDRVSYHLHPDRLPLHDRTAPEDPGEVLFAPDQADRLGRLDHHLLCHPYLDLPDPHPLVHPGAGIGTDGPVDPEDVLAGVLGKPWPDDRGRPLLPRDLDHVTRDQGEGTHHLDGEPGDATAGIVPSRFLHNDFK